MVTINKNRNFCYRICHIQNVGHILDRGLCTKHHPNADPDFIVIGDKEIISTRDHMDVRIAGYGKIGEYIPFYFTPRSIMLYNIVTGYYAPRIPKIPREEILVIRCLISELKESGKFFFTDGQGNDALTNHYNDLKDLDKIDWEIIHSSNFSKLDGDIERPRRYQAEFLIYNQVPVDFIESFHVYNEKSAILVKTELEKSKINNIPVEITPEYFF